MKILETKRLIISEFTLKDAPFVLKLLNTPTWLKYIGDRKVKTLEDAEKYISEKLIKSYQTNGYGLFLVALKEGNASIGMCGLVNREDLDDVDIGFAMLPEYERMGFGYESASAVINYARSNLDLKRIVGITVPENLSSIKLLEKIGLSFEKKLEWGEEEEELLLFGCNL